MKKYSILKSRINKETTILEIEELINRIKKKEISFGEFNTAIKKVAFLNECSLEEFTEKIFVGEFEIQSQNPESELMKEFEKSNSNTLTSREIAYNLLSNFRSLYYEQECEKILEIFAHYKGNQWDFFQFEIEGQKEMDEPFFSPYDPQDILYYMIISSMESLIQRLLPKIEIKFGKEQINFKELENIYNKIKEGESK